MKQLALAVAFLTLASLGNAQAQSYPSRPVTLVLGFAAGGPSDVMARIFGKKLRYVALAFSSLYKPKATKRFLDSLSDLQDCLGAVNDGAVGRHLIRQLVERAGMESAMEISDLQRIQGLVIGWQAHAVHGKVGQFQEVWAEFSETKRFWRSHR
jgi:hypothetical protein